MEAVKPALMDTQANSLGMAGFNSTFLVLLKIWTGTGFLNAKNSPS